MTALTPWRRGRGGAKASSEDSAEAGNTIGGKLRAQSITGILGHRKGMKTYSMHCIEQ
jgi:hypothetical protein